ncbi:MAG: hypothetical protein HY015_03090 [Bacteroidetes bacterium]|nr:hypothetical protein [Bacteroidota bacterium]MBI3481952.1 hypothetical protein [Bacteroidota bacterium]
MMLKCRTGKRVYQTESLAEDALIDAHSRNQYASTGPLAVYQCEECAYYHFTSKGPMNKRLAEQIASGKIKLQQQANEWSRKWKK